MVVLVPDAHEGTEDVHRCREAYVIGKENLKADTLESCPMFIGLFFYVCRSLLSYR